MRRRDKRPITNRVPVALQRSGRNVSTHAYIVGERYRAGPREV